MERPVGGGGGGTENREKNSKLSKNVEPQENVCCFKKIEIV